MLGETKRRKALYYTKGKGEYKDVVEKRTWLQKENGNDEYVFLPSFNV